jgi:hypothetical protein
MNFFLQSALGHGNFTYPSQFLCLVDKKIINLYPWEIIHDQELDDVNLGFCGRINTNNFAVFAKDRSSDFVAAFDLSNIDTVYIFDDFSRLGLADSRKIGGILDWLSMAMLDCQEFLK